MTDVADAESKETLVQLNIESLAISDTVSDCKEQNDEQVNNNLFGISQANAGCFSEVNDGFTETEPRGNLTQLENQNSEELEDKPSVRNVGDHRSSSTNISEDECNIVEDGVESDDVGNDFEIVKMRDYEDLCQTNDQTSQESAEICDSSGIDEIDFRRKIETEESNEQSASAFTSFCSIFQILRAGNGISNQICSKNGIQKFNSPESYQNNYVSERISCCLLGSPYIKQKTVQSSEAGEANNERAQFTVISTSPKPKIKIFSQINMPKGTFKANAQSAYLSLDEPTSYCHGTEISSKKISCEEKLSSQKFSFNTCIGHSVGPHDNYHNQEPFIKTRAVKPNSIGYSSIHTKLKLIHEGDILLCFLNHSRTIISKVLTSKFLRRWENHHIYLQDDAITSKTPCGILASSLPYSNIQEVYTVGSWEQGSQHCGRIVLPEGSILFQACSSLLRDQWLSSILWKKNMHRCRSVLRSSTRPEVILREIKNLVDSALDPLFQDDNIITVSIDIMSKALVEDHIWVDRERREEVILALTPLLDKVTPSLEMFRFFSQHCLLHPKSFVIVDAFTSLVNRILKRTFDFGKALHMRKFAADFMTSLYSQNNGEEALRKFLSSVHGPNTECPHPRVLQNIVAVSLAAIFSYFDQKKIQQTESNIDGNCSQAELTLDNQLECHIAVFRVVSEFPDWRWGLAQLLQPIPFPDDALTNEIFIEGFTPVIRHIGTDARCTIHEMILGIREDKEGWINIYCPSSMICRDEGELWCQMLKTLISCCCRRKNFLQKLTKNLGALLLVALRGHDIAQDILCLMLEWNLIISDDQKMQVLTTLESTDKGRSKYGELCKNQDHLCELQKKKGPKELTLPSRSTDVDVAQLLSSGSFGNLECLSLAFTHVTSSCASQLIQLPTLRCLNLWATHFGDAGLVVIAEHLDKLQVLNLCETPVTDKGILALAGMKSLRKLNLNSTKLSPETLDLLKQQLPSLQELDVRYTDAW